MRLISVHPKGGLHCFQAIRLLDLCQHSKHYKIQMVSASNHDMPSTSTRNSSFITLRLEPPIASLGRAQKQSFVDCVQVMLLMAWP